MISLIGFGIYVEFKNMEKKGRRRKGTIQTLFIHKWHES
jgi:hypothetical protein